MIYVWAADNGETSKAAVGKIEEGIEIGSGQQEN